MIAMMVPVSIGLRIATEAVTHVVYKPLFYPLKTAWPYGEPQRLVFVIRCPELYDTLPARCRHAASERRTQREWEESEEQRYDQSLREWMLANYGYSLEPWQKQWIMIAWRYR